MKTRNLNILRYFFLAFFLPLFFVRHVSAEVNKYGRSFDPQLLQWMKSDVSPQTAMPFSFQILGNKKNAYRDIGIASSATGIIERMIVDQGISIYDAALWQMALCAGGDPKDLARAAKPVEYYWQGRFRDFENIRTGSGQQIFVYDPAAPGLIVSDPSQAGQRGFIFRILNANGKYLATDPLDGKTHYDDFPNSSRIHWEDWKPIAGENAWVVMASLHILNKYPAKKRESAIELKLAEELARAARVLQADNGGIRMAPLGTYYHLIDIPAGLSEKEIAERLDKRVRTLKNESHAKEKRRALFDTEFAEYHIWYFEEISTENNCSWYAAFRMLYQLTGKKEYLENMARIEDYFKSVWDPQKNIFYQGAHWVDGQWKPNETDFAVDVQNWSIVVLGGKTIDQWFGEGAAYRLWKETKGLSGSYNADGDLEGVGFTQENDRVSIEWTAGAILACRKLAVYYALSHPKWAREAHADAKSMRRGIDQYRFPVKEGQAAYSYSSVRRWIPFGWYSHPPAIVSLASTAWVFLLDAGINPFEL